MRTGLGWAPEIPNHWSVVPLNYVAKMGTGHTPDRNKTEYWEECTIPWVTIRDATANPDSLAPLTETMQKISKLGLGNSAAVVHPAGTVMLSRTASVGHSLVVDTSAATSQDFVTWTPGPRLDPRFLLLALRAMKPEWERLAFGSTHRTIYMPDLEALRIPLPPADEQRKIADYIDAESLQLGGLILARRRMKNVLGLKRQRVVEEVLGLASGQPTVPLKFAVGAIGVGIVITPARWYVDTGGVPALRGLNVRPGVIDGSNVVHISQEGHVENIRSRLSAGDVVVVRTGQAGAAAVIPAELNGCNCIDLLTIKPGLRVDPAFLVHFLNSAVAGAQVAEHSVGSIQAHFNVGSMKNLRFPKLDRAEQERRVARLNDIVRGIDELDVQIERQLGLLAERRRSLITAAVTGQIDVTTASGMAV